MLVDDATVAETVEEPPLKSDWNLALCLLIMIVADVVILLIYYGLNWIWEKIVAKWKKYKQDKEERFKKMMV